MKFESPPGHRAERHHRQNRQRPLTLLKLVRSRSKEITNRAQVTLCFVVSAWWPTARCAVTGFIQHAPCLRFIGREQLVSDLFGEKLYGTFVESVVRRVFAQQGIQPRFFLVAPVADAEARTCYALFLDATTIPDPGQLCHNLEAGLAENFHYALCRRLGQLSQARLFHIHRNSVSAEAVFIEEMLSRGLKSGDVKMVPLDRQLGWEQRFHGHFAA